MDNRKNMNKYNPNHIYGKEQIKNIYTYVLIDKWNIWIKKSGLIAFGIKHEQMTFRLDI